MSPQRVLLTGAFGNVGANTLHHLCDQGHEVHAFDVRSEGNAQRQQRLGDGFETHWGDITDPDAVAKVVAEVDPDAIVHVAAIIAPLAFLAPEVAKAVNVDGTRHLMTAAQALPKAPRFIFTSSYTVHGPRNPHRNLPPITGDTPLAPADPYAEHKVTCETMLEGSALPWTIIRLPAVMATDPGWGRDPAFLRFFFTLDPTRREHLLDSRDAGLALANAVTAPGITHARFVLGGPEDCRVTGIDFHRAAMKAMGLRPLPVATFRRSHPDVDASWYAEDWVDTGPSQAALTYQQHTLADYVAHMRAQAGAKRLAMRAAAPFLQAYLKRTSPYWGRNQPDATSQWDAIRETLEITEGQA